MPLDASPLSWLCNYNNVCSIWYDFAAVPMSISTMQLATLERLQIEGIINHKEAPRY